MIKIIAFDFIGVLGYEKNIELSDLEAKLERLFGPNKSDQEYLQEAHKLSNKPLNELIKITTDIINKLYYLKDENLFSKIHEKYPDVLIKVATNHVSYVKEFIINHFDVSNEDIAISAEIGMIKPNKDFYLELTKIFNCEPSDILFIDDREENVIGAKETGLESLKINRGDDVFERITDYLK